MNYIQVETFTYFCCSGTLLSRNPSYLYPQLLLWTSNLSAFEECPTRLFTICLRSTLPPHIFYQISHSLRSSTLWNILNSSHYPPYILTHRFISCGVILLTKSVRNFQIPAETPKDSVKRFATKISIIRNYEFSEILHCSSRRFEWS